MSNYPLLLVFIPLLVGIITQITKFIIFSLKHGFKWRYISTHGHMPSAHSAFAASTVITTATVEGVNSGAFIVAMALAFLIIDDALRLRMYLGEQSRYLNMLTKSLSKKIGLNTKKFPRLKERIGHHKSEVVVGLIYGTILTYLLTPWLN